MGNRNVTPAAVAIAIVFALSCFGATLFVWVSFGGTVPFGSKGYRVHAKFGAEATQVSAGAEARISGVRIGEVSHVDSDGRQIDVEMELDSKYAPLPEDARAIVRSKTLLGETYIELTPGSKRARKLPEGGTLRPESIEAAQSLDQVLGSFDARTRSDLKKFLAGISEALEGRDAEINNALGNAVPGSREALQLLSALDRQDVAVQRLVRDAGRTLHSVGNRADDARGLVRAGEQVLDVTAARNRRLTETIEALPSFLASLRETSRAVRSTARVAAPALRDVRSIAPLVRPALDEAGILAPQLRGLFLDLRPVLTAARTGLPAATQVVKEARPLLDVLYVAGRELVPVVELLEYQRHQLVAGMANTAASTQATLPQAGGPDRHYLRTLTPLNNELPYGASQRYGSNRFNPYAKPDMVTRLAQGLEAFSCANAGNPNEAVQVGASPPCKEQGAYGFRGTTTRYPQVKRDAP